MIGAPDPGHSGGLNIGQKVRKFRKQATLSLDQLAHLSSVSKAMLSQIEQNKTNPTIAVVWKIAKALGVSISDLVDAGDTKLRFQAIRREDERYVFINDEQCTIRTLSPLSLEKDIEFYQIDLQSGGLLESEPHFQNTVEILTVAKGKLRVRSAGQDITLGAGDSVYYCADVAHAISNPGPGAARAYMVVKYRG